MAVINYPPSLPLPLIQGYSYKDVVRFIRTDMDSGTAYQRRRFTVSPTFFQVSFLFSQTDLDTFEQFFQNTLLDGIEYFDIDLAVGAGQAVEHEVRFTETPNVSANSNKYTVTGVLEAVVKVVN